VSRTLVEAEQRPLDDPGRFFFLTDPAELESAGGSRRCNYCRPGGGVGISIYTCAHTCKHPQQMGVHSRLEAAALAAHYVLS